MKLSKILAVLVVLGLVCGLAALVLIVIWMFRYASKHK